MALKNRKERLKEREEGTETINYGMKLRGKDLFLMLNHNSKVPKSDHFVFL